MTLARHGRAAIAIAFVLLGFALYASLAAPGLIWGDSGELQAAAFEFGIPHATGYPTFVLLGGLFSRLGWSDPAYALNIMSSLCGALSLGLLVMVLGELGVSLGASAVAVLAYGLAFTPWHVALRTEVYTLAEVLGLLALWGTLAAHRTGRFGLALVSATLLGLTLTGHLSFALPVAIAGASLAWKFGLEGSRKWNRLLLLAGAFVLGFAPYAQTLLADLRGTSISYYDLVREVHSLHGEPLPGLETPLQRLKWLILGRNIYPALGFALQPKMFVIGMIHGLFILFWFELGPVALGLAAWGAKSAGRTAPRRTMALVAGVVASWLFTAYAIGDLVMHLFLIPAMLLLTLLVGSGLDALRRTAGGTRGREALVLVVAALLVILPGPWIRQLANQHPLTRWQFRLEEETGAADLAWIPDHRRMDDAIRYGRAATERIPRNALFLASWAEFSVMRYVRVVEGRRPDVTVSPSSAETLEERMRIWQRGHDVATHPFVFAGRPPVPAIAAAMEDSIEVTPGNWLYVRRTPLPDEASTPPAASP